MDGREQIKTGLDALDSAQPRSVLERLDVLERRSGQNATTAGEAKDETRDLDRRVIAIEDADRERVEAQNSAKTALRTFAAYFAVSSIVVLLMLKIAGLAVIPMASVFTPALAVVALLTLIQFMNDSGYGYLKVALDVSCAVVLTLIAAVAVIPLAVICLVGWAIPPARTLVGKVIDFINRHLDRMNSRTVVNLAT